MAAMKETLFTGCSVDVEQFTDTEGNLAGRALIIQDPDDNHVYRMPMDVEGSKLLGQKLMGIGSVHIANGKVPPSEEVERAIRSKRSKR